MSSFRMAPLRGTHLQLHPACPSQRSVTMMCAHPPLVNQLAYAADGLPTRVTLERRESLTSSEGQPRARGGTWPRLRRGRGCRGGDPRMRMSPERAFSMLLPERHSVPRAGEPADGPGSGQAQMV